MSHIKVVRNEGDSLTIKDSRGREYLLVDMGTGLAISTESLVEIVAANREQSVTLNGADVIVYRA